jgi:hypothetical protein
MLIGLNRNHLNIKAVKTAFFNEDDKPKDAKIRDVYSLNRLFKKKTAQITGKSLYTLIKYKWHKPYRADIKIIEKKKYLEIKPEIENNYSHKYEEMARIINSCEAGDLIRDLILINKDDPSNDIISIFIDT